MSESYSITANKFVISLIILIEWPMKVSYNKPMCCLLYINITLYMVNITLNPFLISYNILYCLIAEIFPQ